MLKEDSFKSLLDRKETKPVNPIGNQSWIFIRRTDAEAETLILWSSDANNWVTGKDPDSGKDWRQKEKGTTEDKIWLDGITDFNGHEFEQTQADSEGQESLACCSSQSSKELDMAEQLNNKWYVTVWNWYLKVVLKNYFKKKITSESKLLLY